MNSKSRRLFSGFAGVALADILANSVAIIIIMIVVVIMMKHEQEQKKIEQVEEVSVLLSRKIASSVVMNALPTSRPARLHNYKTSWYDINPQHSRMPILELHKDYVRHYYTGEIFPRDELLLTDNRLDRYLKKISKGQLNALRIDIYHIDLFYIAMSILKDHKHYPAHWHFLTYPPKKGVPSGDETLAHADGLKEYNETSTPGENPLSSEDAKTDNQSNGSMEPSGTETQGEPGTGGARTPKNVSLLLKGEGNEDYPYNDLALHTEGGQSYGETLSPSDLPGGSESKSEQQKTSDAVFEALSEMLSEDKQENFNQSASGSGSITARFRSASLNGRNPTNGADMKTGTVQLNEKIDMESVLRALFAFMEKVQTAVDTGWSYDLETYNFQDDVLSLISQLPPARDIETIAFFYALSRIVSNIPTHREETLLVNTDHDEKIRGQALVVPLNQRIQRGTLSGDLWQEQQDNLPDNVLVTSRVGIYPEIYKGLRIPLKEESILLMPKWEAIPYQYSWRVATFVSPQVDDFLTAFIYVALDKRGQLLIATEENAIKISNLRVNTNYPPIPLRKEKWQFFLYGLIAIFIAVSVLRRFKKTA